MLWNRSVCACFIYVIFQCHEAGGIFLVIPEDVATGFAAIYGFSPKIVKGNDHRLGFGFRFGNHADFQVLYEFGPQVITRPIPKIRSAEYRGRAVRRRPVVELLLRTGFLREPEYETNHNINECYEPR